MEMKVLRPRNNAPINYQGKPSPKASYIPPPPESDIEDDIEDSDNEYEEDSDASSDIGDYSITTIDIQNMKKPNMVPFYYEQIIVNEQRRLDENTASCEKIIDRQSHQVILSRKLAVMWMMMLQTDSSFSREALHCAIFYLDTVLSEITLDKREVASYSITAILLATKMFEHEAMEIDPEICKNQRISDEVINNCERNMVTCIEFNAARPTPTFFLRRFLQAISADKKMTVIANFFCELALMNVEFVGQRPDLLALAAACLSKLCQGEYCPMKRLLACAHMESHEGLPEVCGLMLSFASRILDYKSANILDQPDMYLRDRYDKTGDLLGNLCLDPKILDVFTTAH